MERTSKEEREVIELIELLKDVYRSPDNIKAVIELANCSEDRQSIMSIIRKGGEEATPRNIMYAAINMRNDRDGYA